MMKEMMKVSMIYPKALKKKSFSNSLPNNKKTYSKNNNNRNNNKRTIKVKGI